MRLTSPGAPAASAIVPLAVYSNMLTIVSERSSPRTMPSALAAAVSVARASGACATAIEVAVNVAATTTAKVRYDIALLLHSAIGRPPDRCRYCARRTVGHRGTPA